MAEEFNEDMTPEDQNTGEESNNTENKNSTQQFFKKNPQVIKGLLALLLLCFVSCLIVYFVYFYQGPMEYYAAEFCACALEPDANTTYEESIDNFDYLASMQTCFANDFATYGEGMTAMEKKAYLLEFRDEVLDQCPHKIDYVFKYE